MRPGPRGYEMRMLQVPELKRAMGFEESYRFERATSRDRVRPLGNGVCPPTMAPVVHFLTADSVERKLNDSGTRNIGVCVGDQVHHELFAHAVAHSPILTELAG